MNQFTESYPQQFFDIDNLTEKGKPFQQLCWKKMYFHTQNSEFNPYLTPHKKLTQNRLQI